LPGIAVAHHSKGVPLPLTFFFSRLPFPLPPISAGDRPFAPQFVPLFFFSPPPRKPPLSPSMLMSRLMFLEHNLLRSPRCQTPPFFFLFPTFSNLLRPVVGYPTLTYEAPLNVLDIIFTPFPFFVSDYYLGKEPLFFSRLPL